MSRALQTRVNENYITLMVDGFKSFFSFSKDENTTVSVDKLIISASGALTPGAKHFKNSASIDPSQYAS